MIDTMPKERTPVAKLDRTWDLYLKNIEKKSQGFWGDSRSFNHLNGLYESLQLSDTMSISDLVNALEILENVPIETESGVVPLAQVLGQHRYRTLQSLDVSAKKRQMVFCIPENTSLGRFLIHNHQTLLACYERAYFHAKGEVPFTEVAYSQDQLNESQAFLDLENTTQATQLPDKSTIMPDLKRKGVTIYNAEISFGNANNPKDPMAISSLEGFAGDSLSDPHSKASKLYNFGGQFLEAIMLQEFSNTTRFAEHGVGGIERGAVKGHINWSKVSATGEIYASITMKVLSCAFADPTDRTAPQLIFAMGSDGATLIEIDAYELGEVLQRCGDEVNGKTEGNVTPICELNARVKMVPNQATKGYMLKVDQFHCQYFTPDLVSNKNEQLSFRI